MKLTLPYPPTGNLYWRHFRGRVVVSSQARKYREMVRLLGSRIEPLKGAVEVSVDVHRPRRIGDLDNALKVLLDALRGIAYVDDKQVVAIHARRYDDKQDPRAEVTVEEA